MRWWEGWIEAWLLYRMMKLSCRLDYHFNLGSGCICEKMAQAMPVYSP